MGRESVYWFIVSLTFFYIIFKNKTSSVKVLIILCFYSGLASYLGRTIENPYKIVLVLLSLYILQKNNGLSGLSRREGFLLFIFVLFSVSFLYSAIVNEDYFNLVFSQYGKYVTPVCFFFIINRIFIKKPSIFINLRDLLFSLLTIQILLSAAKILTIGLQETTVGSIAFMGGGPAAMLPVLGFMLVWLNKQGELNRKDWIFIFLLIFIGVTSLKRAIWFLMPVIILLFMYYVSRKAKFSKLIFILPLISLIFYVGVRISPSLNREGKMGGSFDLQYVFDYAQSYNFGKTSETSDTQLGHGRGSANLLLWGKLLNSKSLSFNDYWGFGLQEIYTREYEEFNNEKYGVSSKGAVSGIFQTYITSGFVGIILTILLIISISGLIKDPRIRIVIGLLILWDYIFYIGLILRTPTLFVLLFFIILYSNLQFEQRLYRKSINLKPDEKDRNLQPQPA